MVPKADGQRTKADTGYGAGAHSVVDPAGVCNLGAGRRNLRRLPGGARREPRPNRGSATRVNLPKQEGERYTFGMPELSGFFELSFGCTWKLASLITCHTFMHTIKMKLVY